MEEVLPQDMIDEILDKLSNQDLFNYGLTSKTSFQSAERIWKKRYEKDRTDSYDIYDGMDIYWYKKYSLFVISKFLNNQFKRFNMSDNIYPSDRKFIECILECITLNKQTFMDIKLEILRKTIIKTLEEFPGVDRAYVHIEPHDWVD